MAAGGRDDAADRPVAARQLEAAAKELPVSVRSGEKKAALYCMLYCAMFCVLYCVLWRRRRSCLCRYAWKRREGGDNTLCVLCAVWRVLCDAM